MAEDSISLVFNLKEGEHADLEVVAEVALRWVEALRVAAHSIEPEAQIRVEFIDASEGSLRINAVLEWIEEQLKRIDDGSSQYPRLRKLAIALAVFLVTAGPQTYDFYFGDHTMSLSAEDRKRLDVLIEQTQHNPEVETSSRRFFRTIERDPSIKGIGVAEDRHGPPTLLIPSTEFAERGGLWEIQEDEQDRTIYRDVDVVLVRPTLSRRPRKWTFQQEGLPEFDATMKDRRFLNALDEAHVTEQLRTGIQMTIRLEIRERNVEGDWVVKPGGRSVIQVLSPTVD